MKKIILVCLLGFVMSGCASSGVDASALDSGSSTMKNVSFYINQVTKVVSLANKF